MGSRWIMKGEKKIWIERSSRDKDELAYNASNPTIDRGVLCVMKKVTPV